MKSLVKILPMKKILGPGCWTDKFYQIFNKEKNINSPRKLKRN